jgi:hypothetical protein
VYETPTASYCKGPTYERFWAPAIKNQPQSFDVLQL